MRFPPFSGDRRRLRCLRLRGFSRSLRCRQLPTRKRGPLRNGETQVGADRLAGVLLVLMEFRRYWHCPDKFATRFWVPVLVVSGSSHGENRCLRWCQMRCRSILAALFRGPRRDRAKSSRAASASRCAFRRALCTSAALAWPPDAKGSDGTAEDRRCIGTACSSTT